MIEVDLDVIELIQSEGLVVGIYRIRLFGIEDQRPIAGRHAPLGKVVDARGRAQNVGFEAVSGGPAVRADSPFLGHDDNGALGLFFEYPATLVVSAPDPGTVGGEFVFDFVRAPGIVSPHVFVADETRATVAERSNQGVAGCRVLPREPDLHPFDLIEIKALASRIDLPSDPGEIRQRLRDISQDSQTAIEQARTIAHNLRPAELDRVGLTASIEAMIERAAASSPVAFHQHLDPIDGLLSKESEVLLYRIGQELVSNILKHSGARNARLEVRRLDERQIELHVADDGKGLNPTSPSRTSAASGGLGLDSVRERVEMLKGTLEIESRAGKGAAFRIRVTTSAGAQRHADLA